MATPDPTLAKWGRNLASRRALTTPDGTPRLSPLDEKMSQAQCGQQMDPPVHQSTVARWEAGLVEPRRRHKVQLATLYRTDVEMLFPMPAVAA